MASLLALAPLSERWNAFSDSFLTLHGSCGLERVKRLEVVNCGALCRTLSRSTWNTFSGETRKRHGYDKSCAAKETLGSVGSRNTEGV